LTKDDLIEALKGVVTQLRREIRALRAEVNQEIAQLPPEIQQEIAQLRSEMQHQYDDLLEKIRDSQTETLKAFYSYAQATDVKLNDGAAADAEPSRLAIIESRLLEVERRLLMPPQP
jgi:hypothetical protein